MNQVGRFVSECCITLPTATVKARPLYSAYKKWADDAGEHPMTEKAFGNRLAERGIDKSRGSSGNIYHGIGLAAAEQKRSDE
jgi:putative DNA primase/helicase